MRPLLHFVVHFCDLDMKRTWQTLWDKSTNRFEFLERLMDDARRHPGKPDPFMVF